MAVTLEDIAEMGIIALEDGDMESAMRLDAWYTAEEKRLAENPEETEFLKFTKQPNYDPETLPKKEPASMQENISGALDAGKTFVSSQTTGRAGSIAGALQGLAEQIIAGKFGTNEGAAEIKKSMEEKNAEWTRAPETERGQEMLKTVGDALEPLGALSPNFVFNAQAISSAARTAVGLSAARPTVAAIKAGEKIKVGAEKTKDFAEGVGNMAAAPFRMVSNIGKKDKDFIDDNTAAGGGLSAGAMQTPLEQRRIDEAAMLPVPMRLTESQATQDPSKASDAYDLSRIEVVGKPLRDNATKQNKQLLDNFDALIEETGAMLTDALGSEQGGRIQKIFKIGKTRAKAKTKKAYERVKASPVWLEQVQVKGLDDFLNENSSAALTDDIMGQVQKQLNNMKVSEGDFQTQDLKIKNMTFGQTEELRQFINANTDWYDPNGKQQRIAGILIKFIDDEQDQHNSILVRAARKQRTKQAEEFEDTKLISKLLSVKKGTDDRAVKLEDTLKHIILGSDSSVESVERMKKTLDSMGQIGKEAWREIQGGTFHYIKESATKRIQTNQAGETTVSASGIDRALTPLIKSGKLHVLVGKEKARTLEVLRDVARWVKVAPENSLINYAGTAGTLAKFTDFVLSAVPGPASFAMREMVSKITDDDLRKKVLREIKQRPTSWETTQK